MLCRNLVPCCIRRSLEGEMIEQGLHLKYTTPVYLLIFPVAWEKENYASNVLNNNNNNSSRNIGIRQKIWNFTIINYVMMQSSYWLNQTRISRYIKTSSIHDKMWDNILENPICRSTAVNLRWQHPYFVRRRWRPCFRVGTLVFKLTSISCAGFCRSWYSFSTPTYRVSHLISRYWTFSLLFYLALSN